MMVLWVSGLSSVVSVRLSPLLGFLASVYIVWGLVSYTKLSMMLIMDTISVLILSMTLLVYSFMGLSGMSNTGSLYAVGMWLLATLGLVFTTASLLVFYVSFELSLVPMLMIILGWGPQPERLMAGLYMVFYTLVASLPLLGFILLSPGLMLAQPDGGFSVSESWVVLLPFMVKLPVFMLHLWLPKAHVEAPVYGSMVLAATLLKIGAYGVWRLTWGLSQSSSVWAGGIALSGAGICSSIVLRQSDAKSLIAYSSVVHMGMVMLVTLMSSTSSPTPGLMMMVAHGVSSSGLFCIVGSAYERVNSRNLVIMQGLLLLTPGICAPWVLLILANMSAPPSLGLLSEILMIGSCVSLSLTSTLWVALLVVFVLSYSLSLFFNIYHGDNSVMAPVSPGSIKELLLAYAQGSALVVAPLSFWAF